MNRNSKDLLAPYTFGDKVKILLSSENARHSVLRLYGSAFVPLRSLSERGELKILKAEWLNGNDQLKWIGLPVMHNEAWDDAVQINYDLRDYTIVVQMEDDSFIEGHTSPRCKWLIQGNAKLFKQLVGERIDHVLTEMLSRAYDKELSDAKFAGMARICAELKKKSSVVEQK
jgi:hypothetical protein